MNISKSISGLCIISILMSGALVFCSAADEIVDAFQYDDPQELDLQIEHVKGGDTTAFLSPVNTLQAALDLDMVDLIEPTFAWGSAKNLVSMFQEGSVGLPKDREKEAVLNIRFKDSYTGGRTLESLVFVIGGDIGNRNLYDFDMLYSAVQTPSDFVHFFSAQDKGPNAGMTGHANKNPGTGLRVSGFKEQVRDVHTLRIVIRNVTGIATSYMKITADFDSGPAGNSIEKRLGKLGRIERPLESEASATLMFTDKKIHTFSQGMGWNLYMHDGVPGPAAPWWDTFFNLLEWAGCEWVRVPVHFSEWEPENDNDDPFEINWSALRFDQGKLKNEIEIWRRLDQRGIDVLLCNWKFMTRWMSAMAHNNPGKDIGDDWHHTAPYSGEEIGESYAALILHLQQNEGIDNIRYVSIINEPSSSMRGYGKAFWDLYPGMDKALRHYGLRDTVSIVGPELCGGPNALSGTLEKNADAAKYIDVLADHAYSVGFDYNPGPSVKAGVAGYAEAIQTLGKLQGREATFVLSEFGGRASGSSDESFTDSLSNAEQTVRFINAGMDGELRWNWGRVDSSSFSIHRPFLLGKDGEMVPNPSVIYPEAILSRYIRSGWEVMEITVDGARDENSVPRIWAACLRSTDKKNTTVLLVNDGFEVKELTLDNMPTKQFNVLHVTGPIPKGIEQDEPLQFTEGKASINVAPRSIYVLTTMAPGDLEFPKRQAIMARLCQQGFVSEGNTTRLQHVLANARDGKPVTVGVIGGSITGGAGASNWGKSYSPLVLNWWKKTFPQSKITFVGAGIGGTGSMYGALRAHEHLLPKQPDFVITEFAVNDDSSRTRQETLEGLTRQILNQPNQPTNLMLFMLHNRDGQPSNAQEAQQAIGQHYDLPMLSFRNAVWPEIEAGRYDWSDVLADQVHPNDNGHAISAGLVTQFLETVLDTLPEASELPEIPAVPEPLFTDTFEHVKLYRAGQAETRRNDGWTVEKGDWRGPWWASDKPGSVLELKVEGDTLLV
jgi:lysophospholipase L1-like esterase